MNIHTAQHILALNHQFYQTFAAQFSATRQRLQPGVQRLMQEACFGASILDLGCGNGELAQALRGSRYAGVYVGLDFSQGLLDQASAGPVGAPGMETVFMLQDITLPAWSVSLPQNRFDTILAFAVMHHLPGASLRQAFLANVRSRLTPEGLFILSNWQFLNSDRLKQRIQPWEMAGLHKADVDPGDYLLDWRSGGSGLRYVHHFSHSELLDLAAQAGFKVLESFVSDGDTGNLGLYQIWQA